MLVVLSLQENVAIPYRRVLITGATGLLGRAVYKEFQNNAWDALGTGYSRARPRFLKCNLLDEEALRSVIQQFQVSLYYTNKTCSTCYPTNILLMYVHTHIHVYQEYKFTFDLYVLYSCSPSPM